MLPGYPWKCVLLAHVYYFFWRDLYIRYHWSFRIHYTVQVYINLPAGVGLSIINKVPEELMYVSLRNILFDYSSSSLGEALEVSVKNFQVLMNAILVNIWTWH